MSAMALPEYINNEKQKFSRQKRYLMAHLKYKCDDIWLTAMFAIHAYIHFSMRLSLCMCLFMYAHSVIFVVEIYAEHNTCLYLILLTFAAGNRQPYISNPPYVAVVAAYIIIKHIIAFTSISLKLRKDFEVH